MINSVQLISHIIAIKCNIKLPIIKLPPIQFLSDLFNQLVGQINSPWLQANDCGVFQVAMIFKHLVRESPYCN